jgi:hypothetical protein
MLSKPQREALYRVLTRLSYVSNSDADRLAALKVRNYLDKNTYSEKNKSDGEKPPAEPSKPFDSLPDSVKNVDAE